MLRKSWWGKVGSKVEGIREEGGVDGGRWLELGGCCVDVSGRNCGCASVSACCRQLLLGLNTSNISGGYDVCICDSVTVSQEVLFGSGQSHCTPSDCCCAFRHVVGSAGCL